jgi:predicted RNA-binding Zn-ribbon protein involved in translation (DUF1610 family)
MAQSQPSDQREHTFVCPECTEQIAVDESMRTALLDSGCVVCGSTIPATAFS